MVGHNAINRFVKGNAARIDDIFRQLVMKLERLGEIGKETVFQDGTKIESFAGRYTFKWKSAVLKNQAKAAAKAEAVVREAVKLGADAGPDTDDVCARLTSVVLSLRGYARGVSGRGHHKDPRWRLHDQAEELLRRLAGYRAWTGRIGSGRKSCSKTDPDATFMRMKEDHMLGGQLKPAYNVQNAVDSGYVVCCTAVQDRTDYRTAVGVRISGKGHEKSQLKRA